MTDHSLQMTHAHQRIILPLDARDPGRIETLVLALKDHVGLFKLGFELNYLLLELLLAEDWEEALVAIKRLRTCVLLVGKQRIFLDCKLLDIPATVGAASYIIGRMGLAMFNVHCLGDVEMMTAARQESERGAREQGVARPLVLGVTVLTSQDYAGLVRMGLLPPDPRATEILGLLEEARREAIIQTYMERLVTTLARLAQMYGLDGVVASPKEAAAIRRICGPHFLIVSPGIRDPDEPVTGDDQERTMTPEAAMRAGVDFPVIGRPISKAVDPIVAAIRFASAMERGLLERTSS